MEDRVEDRVPRERPDLGRMAYNYAIVGVQKAGTTTLAGTLVRHRLVCRPPRKEARYFNDESLDWDHPDHERNYTAPRRAPNQRLVGDATPAYLFWPGAMERIHAYDPALPLIAIFRDPIERLFSHWVMLRARNPDAPDWPRFLTLFPGDVLPERVPNGVDPGIFKHYSGVARGLYGAQLQRGLALFAREQWLLVEFRDMLARFEAHVDAATDHLGLPRFRTQPPLLNRYAGAQAVAGTAPSADDLQALAAGYSTDLALFERLSGLDTTGWPTRRILEGTLDPDELAAKLATRVRPA